MPGGVQARLPTSLLPFRGCRKLSPFSRPHRRSERFYETSASLAHLTRRRKRKETIVADRLAGKVTAITGGSQGIGMAIAQRFAQEGADLSFCDNSNKACAS